MPNVRCVAIAGLEIWFNSKDHLPPHFHAEKKDEWEVRVMFMRDPPEIEFAWGSAPSGRDKKELLAAASKFRLELFDEWEKAVCVKEPGAKE